MATATDPTIRLQRLGSQRGALAILDDLLKASIKTSLPVITWTVGDAGANLVGRASGYPATDRRGEITAWAEHLGITLNEHQHASGMVNLTGKAERRLGGARATVVLTAEWFKDDEDQADEVAG